MKTEITRNSLQSPVTRPAVSRGGDGNSNQQAQHAVTRLAGMLGSVMLALGVSGCYSIPISQDDYKTETRKELADSLIGESRETVVERIGAPDQVLTDGRQQYLLYEHQSSAKVLGMMVYIPIVYADSQNHKTLHCLKFDLDVDQVVVDYEFDSSAHYSGYGNYKCHSVFWEEEEWHALEQLPVPPLQGDSMPDPDNQIKAPSAQSQNI